MCGGGSLCNFSSRPCRGCAGQRPGWTSKCHDWLTGAKTTPGMSGEICASALPSIHLQPLWSRIRVQKSGLRFALKQTVYLFTRNSRRKSVGRIMLRTITSPSVHLLWPNSVTGVEFYWGSSSFFNCFIIKFLCSLVRSSLYLLLSKQSCPSLTTQSSLSSLRSKVFFHSPWQFKTPVNFSGAFSV